MIRVLIVDDNDIIRTGLTALLTSVPDVEVVGEAATGREAIARTEALEPDVVLLDVRMPVMDGLSAAGPISERAKVLMLTYADDPDVVAGALRNGASGYLVHGTFGPPELASAIRDVAGDGTAVSPGVMGAVLDALRSDTPTEPPSWGLRGEEHPLTEREAEVMDAIARGRSNPRIAEELFLAEKTVKNTINRIYTKLGVTTRAEAIARWVGTGDVVD